MSNTLDGTGTYKMQHTLVDVAINVCGKPYQTLYTLKSLMKYSGKWIDKIYFQEEKHHPYGDEVKWILSEFDNLIHYTPEEFYGIAAFEISKSQMETYEKRCNIRYQYGIETSDKKYIFITHNDILYTGDIIGGMMEQVDGYTGIGLIGQCWNCSGFTSGNCDGNRFDKVNYTYEEVEEMMRSFPPARHHYFYQQINKERPMPLPECRLNEFACIINREDTMKECYPNGTVRLFGGMEILDTGCAWFKDMYEKGYKFKNYDINKDSIHGEFSHISSRFYEDNKEFFVSGNHTMLDEKAHHKAEELAKEYYEQNFK